MRLKPCFVKEDNPEIKEGKRSVFSKTMITPFNQWPRPCPGFTSRDLDRPTADPRTRGGERKRTKTLKASHPQN